MPPKLLKLWHWLTEPNPKIQSLEERYYAKLLAVALVIFLPVGIWVGSTTPSIDIRDVWANFIAFSIFIGAYILLRLGYFTVAVAVTFFVAFARVFFSAAWVQSYESLYFLIVPFFFGAAVLPTWLMIAFLAASAIGMYVISMYQQVALVEDIGWRVVSITMMSGVIAVWVNWSRNMMERQRRNTLEASETRYREAYELAEAEIVERKRVEDELSGALEERGVLLKEIHHRVKNNLQTTKSLLYLQSRQFDDPIILAALQDSQNRVLAMALVHELLYQTENLKYIDFNRYINDLTRSLRRTYAKPIVVNAQLNDDIRFNIDTAIPCGLIVNELISNSMKYAFPENGAGNIEIIAATDTAGHITLTIADNGIGIPEKIDPLKTSSMGLQLVQSLTRQLGGAVQFLRDNGTVVTIDFDINPANGAVIIH